jgi:hypothetical protein
LEKDENWVKCMNARVRKKNNNRMVQSAEIIAKIIRIIGKNYTGSQITPTVQ